jgi:RNA polymerase sigma factor (sigma-70 family)
MYRGSSQSRDRRMASLLDYLARGGMVFRLSMSDVEDQLKEIEDSCPAPDARMRRRQEIYLVRSMVDALPAREREVIKDYYFNEKSLAQIAREHGNVSKSWISRIHTKAIERLRILVMSAEALHDN